MLDSDDVESTAPLTVTGRAAAIASGCTSTVAAASSSSPVPVLLVVVIVRDDGDNEETVVGDDDDDEGEISTSVNSSSSSAPPPPAPVLVVLLAGEIVDAVSTDAVLVSLVGSILIFYLLVYIVCLCCSLALSQLFSLSFCSFTNVRRPSFL